MREIAIGSWDSSRLTLEWRVSIQWKMACERPTAKEAQGALYRSAKITSRLRSLQLDGIAKARGRELLFIVPSERNHPGLSVEQNRALWACRRACQAAARLYANPIEVACREQER